MKKGLKTLIAGILLFVIGAFVVPIAMILPLILDGSKETQFMIPGSAEVDIEKPGRYYLWNDYQTVFEGKSYNRSEGIPDGLEISIKSANGEKLKFVSDTSISSSSGSSSKHSIGYIQAGNPGKLTVAVSGTAEPRVFSFSESGIMKMLGLIFAGSAISILVALTGILTPDLGQIKNIV
ncbi:MAG: hypothetical protein PHD76_10200 [Methylacidiphilales bacterium]|nr:hypothetical protein [Candidatus Methylacidiphilales bacterium]